MFFLRRKRPLRLAAGHLRALRLSLNTPVVATQDLPVGPARAAIALHAEPGNGVWITVGVRSLAGGAVALYCLEGGIASGAVNEAMDGALSFAEGMGFLFDDDLVGGDAISQEKALLRWNEAIGDPAPPEAPSAKPDLEEVVDLFDFEEGELTDPPVSPVVPHTALEIELAVRESPEVIDSDGSVEEGLAFRPAAAAATLPLTKFRVRADASAALDAAEAIEPPPRGPGKRPLGRVRLVKRRPNETTPDARRRWLLRLLMSL